MDNDYSVFSILPPYNTIHAQVIMSVDGAIELITNTGYAVTYRAIADPDGSINRTSEGKGNFSEYVLPLFGLALGPDEGLPVPGPESYYMPGTNNAAQEMSWDTNAEWHAAYGIPIAPFDDSLHKNSYPLMRLTASNGAQAVASSDIVVPVSDEMDCRACHTSGGDPAELPADGWAWDPSPRRDYRLNPLRFHDDQQAVHPLYAAALATNSYLEAGLFATVIEQGTPILCASCHASEALPGSGYPGIPPLTEVMHTHHAGVEDPATGMLLDAAENRTSCYRCHPGSATRCLRGAMGSAVAADTSLAMQCQDCHGHMTSVGSTNRTGWLEEPNCQACHSGDAVNNEGQIRYENAFATNDVLRDPANRRFATNPDTPGAGLSLFRFSRGHGGLYCQACHGSTHAEYPSAFRNDNLYSQQLQGHEGQLVECSTCHGISPSTVTNGPHGMHPVGQPWISGHPGPAKVNSATACRVCHGTDHRGTVLSRSKANRTLVTNSDFGDKNFWRGYQISCYVCHKGPTESGTSENTPPVAYHTNTSTQINTPVTIGLRATDANGNPLTFRIVSQGSNGRIGLTGTNATYVPDTSFAGIDTFTFAAWDGYANSNLATGRVAVAGGTCTYAILPSAQSFNELSHQGSVAVTTGGGCPWLASSEASWIQILTADDTDSGTVLYGIDRNPSLFARTGTIFIAGLYLTVTQSGYPADANMDGLPDNWQTNYFGSVSSTNAQYDADPDGDGSNNGIEYLAETDPTNTASILEITSLSRSAGALQSGFSTRSNRYYHLQRTESMDHQVWLGFTNALPGTGGTLYIPDAVSTGHWQRYYRARLAY